MAGSGFMLQWPTDNGRVTTPFSSSTGTVSIAAAAGTAVKAGVAGRVVAAGGDSVQISSGLYMVVYSNLRNLVVQAGQDIAAGAALGESAGPDSIRLMVLQVVDPTPMLPAASQAAPTAQQPATGQPTQPAPAASQTATRLYVTPTQSGLRIREKPVDGNVLTQVNTTDVLEVVEDAAGARAKIGAAGQWINVKTLFGSIVTGFSAGQFLQEYKGPFPIPAPTPVSGILGMNLDMFNPLGRPKPERLKGLGWIRVKFNVSFNPDNGTYGNTDINATFNRVRPFIEPYVKAGMKVLMVFTHQLYGEGAGFHWPSMDSGRWNQLIPTYADYAKRAAALFANTGLVHCYQIWNEQDTEPKNARAAVPIPARDYANMLTQTIRAIRSVDSRTPIITGGHVGGPDAGSAYARATLAAMPGDVRPDGIASHPYGRGVAGHKFSNWGPLEEEIRKYSAVMPGKPIWFTEWGVLDRQGDMSIVPDVTSYATGFMNIIKTQFPGQVACAIWYAWADGMDNGYGIVDAQDREKGEFARKFLTL